MLCATSFCLHQAATEMPLALQSKIICFYGILVLPTGIFGYPEKGFPVFLKNLSDPVKEEYRLPIIADAMLQDGVTFTVLFSHDY